MAWRARTDAELHPKQGTFPVSGAEAQHNIYPAGIGNYYCGSPILPLLSGSILFKLC